VLIQPLQPVINTKFFWKMKIPLKTKVFAWYLRRDVIQSAIAMEVRSVYFVITMRQLSTYSSNATLQDLYGQSSKKVLPYTQHELLPIFLVIGLME
jgi:hypothetical protein